MNDYDFHDLSRYLFEIDNEEKEAEKLTSRIVEFLRNIQIFLQLKKLLLSTFQMMMSVL